MCAHDWTDGHSVGAIDVPPISALAACVTPEIPAEIRAKRLARKLPSVDRGAAVQATR